MVLVNDREILAQLLKNLSKPALRALCKRVGLSGFWSKRKHELIEDLLVHTAQLTKDFDANPVDVKQFTSLVQGLSEIQAGQADLKRHVQAERQALASFFVSKIQVSWREKLLYSMASWASLVALVITLVSLAWPVPREVFLLTIRVLDDDGRHAIGASVLALPWLPIAMKDHWLLSIPVEDIPADGTLSVSAFKNEGVAVEQVHIAQHRKLSVTMWLRYPKAFIRGIVLSPDGEPAGGVQVSVYGHEAEAVLSAVDGSFSLPAHVPSGDLVALSAKKGGLRRVGHYAAGAHHEILLIDRSSP